MTTAGFIVPTITGILSTCCSVLILYAIYKSPHKLSTTYHRIMAMMSIFDILASVCIAFTTLPMPSDDIVRFAGPMLGNHVTCQMSDSGIYRYIWPRRWRLTLHVSRLVFCLQNDSKDGLIYHHQENRTILLFNFLWYCNLSTKLLSVQRLA